MLKKLNNSSRGFTIIEVLIVLAIAGLILLIVFLAVPALQRNSRNTQRRNDVSTYLGAVSEWSNNNSGKVPVTADLTAANGINSLAKLGRLTAPTTVHSGGRTGTVATDNMEFVTNARCSTTSTGDTEGGTSNRQYAVRFTVEGSGGAQIEQCQES